MMDGTDLERIRATARLARLALDEEELRALAPELGRILAAFEVLARFTAAAPAPEDAPPPAAAGGRTRGDMPQPSLPREEILAAAPSSEDGFFAVPKTVGGEG
jgi:aspartyl-tRNA(Asn)/glutamyl-tRNA(Gln) amidotransferase subunit C